MKKYMLVTLFAVLGVLWIVLPLRLDQNAHAQENTTTDFVAPVVFQAAGPNAASIQSTIDAYRAELGNPDNRNSGTLETGHREINWDGGGGVDTTTAPVTPFNTFLNTRGSQFTTPGIGLLRLRRQVGRRAVSPHSSTMRATALFSGPSVLSVYSHRLEAISPTRSSFYPAQTEILRQQLVDSERFSPTSISRMEVAQVRNTVTAGQAR
jgi:hypothetical protein